MARTMPLTAQRRQPPPLPAAIAAAAAGGGLREKRRASVPEYLQMMLWCAHMYLSGKCPDFSAAYTFPWAPTAREIASVAAAEEERTGAPFAPAYEAPPAGVAGEPLPPDQFCMCVLPPERARRTSRGR